MTLTRLKEFGSWSEQTSSSGKRYYYNRDTEVSQWEKPAEWKEHEKVLIEKFKLSKAQKAGFLRNQHSIRPSTSINNTLAENNLTNASVSTLSSNKSPSSSSLIKYPIVNNNANKTSFTNESFCVSQGLQKNSLKRLRDDDNQGNEIYNLYQSVPKTHRNNANFASLSSSRHLNFATLSVQTNAIPQQSNSGFSTFKLAETSINTSLNTLNYNSSFASVENLSLANQDPSKQQSNNLSINQQSPHLDCSNSNLRMILNVTSKTNVLHSQKASTVITNSPKVTPNVSTDKTTNIIANKQLKNFSINFSSKKSEDLQKIQSDHNLNSQILIKPSFKLDERKYAKLYRADLIAYRRNWSSDAYLSEAKKLVDRSTKQTLKLNSIDEDIRSVCSLIKAAEMRCKLLGQKLTFIRQEITNLETKNPIN